MLVDATTVNLADTGQMSKQAKLHEETALTRLGRDEALEQLSRIACELANYNAQMEKLAGTVAGGSDKVAQGLRECLDRLDHLSVRGKDALGQFERLSGLAAETLHAVHTALWPLGRAIAAARWVVRLPGRVGRRVRGAVPGSALRVSDLQATAATPPAEARQPLGEILPGVIIEQTVVCPDDGFHQVALMLGTYRRTNTSRLTLSVWDAAGQMLRETTRSASGFADNEFSIFHFPPIADSQGRSLRLRISTPDAESTNAVTLWTRKTSRPAGLAYNGRTVADAELIVRLGCQPRPPVHAVARGVHRDLVIITPDHLGTMRIGLAMRHWEIAQALTQAGLRVTLASTRPIPADLPRPGFHLEDLSRSSDRILEVASRHAAVMVQGTVLTDFPALRDAGRPLVADMVTPMHIEGIETSQEHYVNSLKAIQHCLETADFFVCGNERQRLYWLGMLTAMGRVSKEDHRRDREFRQLIDVLHFGLPDEEPKKVRQVLKGVHPGIGRDDFLLIWFGGIWNWLDPLPLVRAVHAAHQEDPRIKLFFSMYRKNHEQPHAMAVRTRQLCEELGALDRCVFFHELPVPFDQRADYLLESDLGVIVQAANFETQLSARTRALDYLWANLPILINQGDETAELVAQHGIGVVAESNRAEDLQRALLQYVRNDARRRQAVEAVRELRETFRWSSTVQPLLRFCQALRG